MIHPLAFRTTSDSRGPRAVSIKDHTHSHVLSRAKAKFPVLGQVDITFGDSVLDNEFASIDLFRRASILTEI